MFYIWIHRLDYSVGDLKIPFINVDEALEFGKKYLDVQVNNFYDPHVFDKNVLHDEGEFFIGGCGNTQVAVITASYEPKEGWAFWADAYYIVTGEKAMSLGPHGSATTVYANDQWEK
jgi:hypothetical protein